MSQLLDLLPELSEQLQKALQIRPAPFPTQRIAEQIFDALGWTSATYHLSQSKWSPYTPVEGGTTLSFFVPSLGGHCFVHFTASDLQCLYRWSTNWDTPKQGEILHPEFGSILQQFYAHLVHLALEQTLGGSHPFNLSSAQPEAETLYCHYDLTLTHHEGSIHFQLWLEASMVEQWNETQQHQYPWEAYSEVPITLSLFCGETPLSVEEFQTLEEGDCVLLDRCSMNPEQGTGHVELFLFTRTFARGALRKEGIKVLDYHQEESVSESNEEEFSIGNLPLTMKIELDTLSIPLRELISLGPGQLLPFTMNAQQSVSCIVQGKRVAKGHLVRLGDQIGVRIDSILASHASAHTTAHSPTRDAREVPKEAGGEAKRGGNRVPPQSSRTASTESYQEEGLGAQETVIPFDEDSDMF